MRGFDQCKEGVDPSRSIFSVGRKAQVTLTTLRNVCGEGGDRDEYRHAVRGQRLYPDGRGLHLHESGCGWRGGDDQKKGGFGPAEAAIDSAATVARQRAGRAMNQPGRKPAASPGKRL